MAITSVTVTPSSVYLKSGGAVKLTATVVVTAGEAQTVTWSSNNANVLVDSNGQVTSTSGFTGTATITATSTVDTNKKGTSSMIQYPVSNLTTFGIMLDYGVIPPLFRQTANLSSFGIMVDYPDYPTTTYKLMKSGNYFLLKNSRLVLPSVTT